MITNQFKCFITYRRNMKRSKTLMNEGHSPRTRRNRRRGAFWGRLWLVWSPFSLMPWAQWVCAAVILRCAPVTLDAPGQSEGEIPREGPAPHRQAPCWPIRGREGDIQSPPLRCDALCWTSHDSDDSCAKGEAGAFASVKMWWKNETNKKKCFNWICCLLFSFFYKKNTNLFWGGLQALLLDIKCKFCSLK